MSESQVIHKLIKRYQNLEVELQIAYENKLSYEVISLVYRDLYKVKQALIRHNFDPDSIL